MPSMSTSICPVITIYSLLLSAALFAWFPLVSNTSLFSMPFSPSLWVSQRQPNTTRKSRKHDAPSPAISRSSSGSTSGSINRGSKPDSPCLTKPVWLRKAPREPQGLCITHTRCNIRPSPLRVVLLVVMSVPGYECWYDTRADQYRGNICRKSSARLEQSNLNTTKIKDTIEAEENKPFTIPITLVPQRTHPNIKKGPSCIPRRFCIGGALKHSLLRKNDKNDKRSAFLQIGDYNYGELASPN